MKDATPEFAASLAATGLTLCRVWTLTLKNGTIIRRTDHDQDVVFGGNNYSARSGFQLSAIRTTLNEGVANATISVALSDDSDISEDTVKRGVLDDARLVVTLIDYTTPDAGSMPVIGGRIGRQRFTELNLLDADIDGSAAGLGRTIGEHYSQNCRNQFGDRQCRYPVETLRTPFTVTSVGPASFVAAETVAPVGYWAFGVVTWTSGNNAGNAYDVTASEADGRIALGIATGFTIEPGDQGTITPGCSKERSMCADRWKNLMNIRAEPDAPTITNLKFDPGTIAPLPPISPGVITGGTDLPWGPGAPNAGYS